MRTLLIVLLAFTTHASADQPRVAQETNVAPDVSAPIPYATVAPKVADLPAAEAKIRSLNAKVIDGKLAIAQKDGQIIALKEQLENTQEQIDQLMSDKVDGEIDLGAVKTKFAAALEEPKRLADENDKLVKKLDVATTGNLELMVQRFILLSLLALGCLAYFRLRHHIADILIRVPNDETKVIIHDLNHELTVANLTVAELRGRRDALSRMLDDKEKENSALRLLHSRRVESLETEISRLVALQQGSEATIAELQGLLDRVADKGTLAALATHVKAAMANDADAPPAALEADPALAAAHSAAIDAIEKSRASLHTADADKTPNIVPEPPHEEPVPVRIDSDEPTRKIEEPESK